MEPPPDPPTLRWEAIVAVRSFPRALGLKLPRDCRWIGAGSGNNYFDHWGAFLRRQNDLGQAMFFPHGLGRHREGYS